MSDKSKLIMETIALVRSRKARPDIERICKTMQRNHGVEAKETERWLDILCDRGIVARRPFKGAVSYRIVADEKAGAAKATARYQRNAKKIAKAIADLDPHGLGVSFNAIERYVSTHWPLTCSILSLRVRLRSSLRDGIEEGRFVKTLNGAYKLGSGQSGVEEVTEEETNDDVNDENGDELLCDYCQLSADRNPQGEPEELLICKDCGNKAHPSCLNYSAELVEQIRADDSWQCIDCKACTICDGTGDPDSLLFCDACDKGYHMNCHTPKLDQMPSGKWMCSLCAIKRSHNDANDVYIIEEDNTITGPENNSHGQSPVPVSTGGPPTMVQIQRTSQLQKGTPPTQTAVLRTKPPPIRPRPGNSQFKQPMIALGLPNASQFRPTISVMTTPPGMVPSPQVTLNPPAYSLPLTPQTVSGKLPSHSVTHAVKITQGNYLQDAHIYLREDILRSLPSDVADWSVADVCYYIKSHGFPGESKLFEEQEVDGKALLLMSRNDVLTGLRLKLGPALKIYHLHVSKLQSRTDFIGV